MKTKAIVNLLKTIATERRIEMLMKMREAGQPLPSGTIGAMVGLEDGAAAFNLKALSNVGLVTRQQSGNFAFYSLNEIVFEEIVKFFTLETKDASRRDASETSEDPPVGGHRDGEDSPGPDVG